MVESGHRLTVRGALAGTNKGRVAVVSPTSYRVADDEAALERMEDDDDADDDGEPVGMGDLDPHVAAGGTLTAAVFGIVKAMVGPAILYLPRSFADAGYLFGLVALMMSLLMYLYSSGCLLQSWHFVRKQQQQSLIEHEENDDSTGGSSGIGSKKKKRRKSRDNTVDNEVEMVSLVDTTVSTSSNTSELLPNRSAVDAILPVSDEDQSENDSLPPSSGSVSYPQLARMAYDDLGENFVRAGITLMQLGVCLTYLIFVPRNLSASILTLTRVHVPLGQCLLAMALLEVPLSSIRDIRKLVYTNVLANVLIAFGLVSCLYLALTISSERRYGEDESPNHKALGAWNEKWYLFIGTSVLLFEGSITLCLPLQEAIQGQESVQKFPAVYRGTISCIVLFYSFFGIICWSAFGDDISTVLTTSLPEGVLATMVQLAYSVAVIFTFPLQIFPALEIIVLVLEQKRARNIDGQISETAKLSRLERVVVAAAVIALLSMIAMVEMENLGRVVSLLGALLGVPLAFIFPPLIHSKVVPSAPKRTNLAVAVAGLLAMVGATFTTLETWSGGGERRRG